MERGRPEGMGPNGGRRAAGQGEARPVGPRGLSAAVVTKVAATMQVPVAATNAFHQLAGFRDRLCRVSHVACQASQRARRLRSLAIAETTCWPRLVPSTGGVGVHPRSDRLALPARMPCARRGGGKCGGRQVRLVWGQDSGKRFQICEAVSTGREGRGGPSSPAGGLQNRSHMTPDALRCSTTRETPGIARQSRVGGFAHLAIGKRGVWMLPCQNVSENPDFHNAFFILQAVDATGGNGIVQ